MMRQAVPLIRPEAPNIRTCQVASDSRVLINAEGDGVIEYVDANISTRILPEEERMVFCYENIQSLN
jgi:DNA-directed RNA polymerase subunit beta